MSSTLQVDKILHELDTATDSVVDHIQNSDELKNVQKKAGEAAKGMSEFVEKAAQSLDRVAEKAGNAISSFLENVTRKPDAHSEQASSAPEAQDVPKENDKNTDQ